MFTFSLTPLKCWPSKLPWENASETLQGVVSMFLRNETAIWYRYVCIYVCMDIYLVNVY